MPAVCRCGDVTAVDPRGEEGYQKAPGVLIPGGRGQRRRQAIHGKAMSVLLTTQAAFDAWLSAKPDGALKPQRPLPSERLGVVARAEQQEASRDATFG